MTESRDQQFFDALSDAGRDDGDDPPAGAPNTGAPGDSGAPAAPLPPQRFAAGPDEDDPASGRHHVDPPAGEGAGGWGQPSQATGHSVPSWTASTPPSDAGSPQSSPTPAAPQVEPQELEGPFQDPANSPLQGFPPPADEVTAQLPPSASLTGEGPADAQRHATAPPPAAWQQPPAGQHAPHVQGPAQQDAAAPALGPRPVASEERTQFLSRDALRTALSPNSSPPSSGWPPRPGAPQSGPEQRTNVPPPGWPAREAGASTGEQSVGPGGPRPPEWDWSQGAGFGGSELRSEQISASELIAPRKIPSSRGWRKWLYVGSFKLINTGESPDEQLMRNLNATVAGHLRGTYSIVVLGGKGGVGKTTTTAAIGSTFAALRKDKVIAIDANPDRASNLADRIDPKATNSYKDVLSDRNLHGYSDIRSHVGMNEAAGLDVLGNRYQADRQPLTAKIYADTHALLERFYSVLISDSGTDVDHPVIPGLMSRADALIMVASTAPDGAKGAAELMDWAYEAGYHRLLQRTAVVINDVRGQNGSAHRKLVDSLVEKFSRWVSPQRVFVVPFDAHIASAGVIDINELRPQTRRRYLEITARLASGFNSSEGGQ